MDPKHRKVIQDNISMFVEKSTNLESILEILLEEKVINSYMANNITKIPERKERYRNFYELIQRRGPEAFRQLTKSLRKTGNTEVEAVLSDKVMETYNADESFLYSPPQVSLSFDEEDNCDDVNIKVTVHPEGKFMDTDEENLPLGAYRMRSRPKGYAIIINIMKAVGHQDRVGSEVDVSKLKKLFSELGYITEVYEDLTLNEIETVVKNFSKSQKLAAVDSIVVFLMCHGQQNPSNIKCVDLIASDGQIVQSDWIIEQFMAPKSPFIIDDECRKPKLFFFQACRGNKRDEGFCPSDGCSSQIDATRFEVAHSSRSHRDAFIVYSTIPGHYSKRDPVSGGWYVNEFCKIVADNAYRYDLDTMASQVDEELGKRYDKVYGFQTPETVKRGFTKKMFFNPGLYEDDCSSNDDSIDY